MVRRDPPPAEPAVAALLRRLDACYHRHVDHVVLDPWVRDVAQNSPHDEVAAGALTYLANNASFEGNRDNGIAYLDRADEIYARAPITRESLLMRWVSFNARGLLVRPTPLTRASLREAIDHHMAGMRFAAAYGLERGIAVSGINAGWELVRLGEPVEALMLMTQLLEMNTFDQRRYALIREVTGLALASAGYYDDALGQFQLALDWIEPTSYAQRVRVSLSMANCALDAEQLDIARFELTTARAILDFIESERGSAGHIETNRRYLDQIEARIRVRDGECARAHALVDEALRGHDDWFVHASNTALDVWLKSGTHHYAFDGTKPAHEPALGGQLRYAVLLERCAAETGRYALALELRRKINAERSRYSVAPDVVLRLAGPNTAEIKARQERTQIELAQILALAEWQDNLLAMTAHELRGPLAALQLASELLVLDAERSSERLQTLVPLVERIRRTTEGFQSLIHFVDNPVTNPIEPRPIADELGIAVESLRDAAQAKNITIHTQGLDVDARAHIGRGYVVICVANLISNAIKYSPPGTAIEVAAALIDDRILIDVCDQGPGIEPSDRAVAFDWQVRLDHKPTGNETSQGIGLSITRTLVEAAGGTVEILDRPHNAVGTHFRITLRSSGRGVLARSAERPRGGVYRSSPPLAS